jgi:transcription initiation factor TFIID subunit TAF12
VQLSKQVDLLNLQQQQQQQRQQQQRQQQQRQQQQRQQQLLQPQQQYSCVSSSPCSGWCVAP